jgi:hypothetical protein
VFYTPGSDMQDRFVLEGKKEDGMRLTVCMAAAGATLFSSEEMARTDPMPL